MGVQASNTSGALPKYNSSRQLKGKYADNHDNHRTTRYKNFSFGGLPVEVGIQILETSGSSSQSTYRALLLTSHFVRDIVRVKCLRNLPIIISKTYQLDSFLQLLSDKEIGHAVRHLWIIPEGSVLSAIDPCLSIVNLCPNLLSLACISAVLIGMMSSSQFIHHQCMSVTVKGWSVPSTVTQDPRFHSFPLFQQLKRLHVIGPFSDRRQWPLPSIFGKLTSLSFSIGKDNHLAPDYFTDVARCPSLRRVAIITKLPPPMCQHIAATVASLGSKFSLRCRPRRWTETKIWMDEISDEECLWKLKSVDPLRA